jgi:hypothetical protein
LIFKQHRRQKPPESFKKLFSPIFFVITTRLFLQKEPGKQSLPECCEDCFFAIFEIQRKGWVVMTVTFVEVFLTLIDKLLTV